MCQKVSESFYALLKKKKKRSESNRTKPDRFDSGFVWVFYINEPCPETENIGLKEGNIMFIFSSPVEKKKKKKKKDKPNASSSSFCVMD